MGNVGEFLPVPEMVSHFLGHIFTSLFFIYLWHFSRSGCVLKQMEECVEVLTLYNCELLLAGGADDWVVFANVTILIQLFHATWSFLKVHYHSQIWNALRFFVGKGQVNYTILYHLMLYYALNVSNIAKWSYTLDVGWRYTCMGCIGTALCWISYFQPKTFFS
jgi:hypothetical protein